jgi:hypothetical protein
MRPFKSLVDVFPLRAGFDSTKLPGKVDKTRDNSRFESIPNKQMPSFAHRIHFLLSPSPESVGFAKLQLQTMEQAHS